jgi:hypothetical protein
MAETGAVPDPGETADRLAILEVLTMHSRGIDRASTDMLKSCYWPEADVDYGGYKGPAHAFCEVLPDAIKRYQNTQHQISNTHMEFHGDTALVETYVTAHHYLAVDTGEDTEMTYIGRYLDRMEKRENTWKIRFRKIVMTWHQYGSATGDEEANPSLKPIARASHDADDPLFEFLNG